MIFADDTIIGKNKNSNKKIVSNGNPIAQQDGYLNSKWSNLNITFVTDGKNKLPTDFNGRMDGPLYWNTGPPYLATVHDMYNIAKLWTEYAPRVYKIHPELFAEMVRTCLLNLCDVCFLCCCVFCWRCILVGFALIRYDTSYDVTHDDDPNSNLETFRSPIFYSRYIHSMVISLPRHN